MPGVRLSTHTWTAKRSVRGKALRSLLGTRSTPSPPPIVEFVLGTGVGSSEEVLFSTILAEGANSELRERPVQHLGALLTFLPKRRSLLGDAGLHVVGAEAGASLDMHDLQQVLSDKMHLDADAAASFVAGLRLYMDDDPYKVTPPFIKIPARLWSYFSAPCEMSVLATAIVPAAILAPQYKLSNNCRMMDTIFYHYSWMISYFLI